MKKHLLSIFALVVCATVSWAIDQSYYASIDGTTGATLRNELCNITRLGPQNMSYKKLWEAYYTTDVYPADSVGKAGKIWDMYSNVLFTPGDNQCGTYSKVGDCYNREHSMPKSWFNEQQPAYFDLGHIVPTDGYVNNQRSNYAFGECANGTRLVNGNKVGKGKLGASTFPGYTISASVFEPDDEYKGDFARMYMYMRVRYKDMDMTNGEGGIMFNDNDVNFGLTYYSVDLLMKWHRQDPVSKKEVDRNNGMESVQNNRNPFIDYPILAEYLWGTRIVEAFSFRYAMASFDPDFIWGVSDGSRHDTLPPTPPTPVDTVRYGITWSVNGEVLYVDSIQEDSPILVLPDSIVSCSTLSNEFVGWTDEAITTAQDAEPAVLYLQPSQFPLVTADVTYYAVFAQPVDDAYIRFITVCQSEEEVELIPTDEPARKIFIGGHIYLQVNNQLYNLQGQQVK